MVEILGEWLQNSNKMRVSEKRMFEILGDFDDDREVKI